MELVKQHALAVSVTSSEHPWDWILCTGFSCHLVAVRGTQIFIVWYFDVTWRLLPASGGLWNFSVQCVTFLCRVADGLTPLKYNIRFVAWYGSFWSEFPQRHLPVNPCWSFQSSLLWTLILSSVQASHDMLCLKLGKLNLKFAWIVVMLNLLLLMFS